MTNHPMTNQILTPRRSSQSQPGSRRPSYLADQSEGLGPLPLVALLDVDAPGRGNTHRRNSSTLSNTHPYRSALCTVLSVGVQQLNKSTDLKRFVLFELRRPARRGRGGRGEGGAGRGLSPGNQVVDLQTKDLVQHVGVSDEVAQSPQTCSTHLLGLVQQGQTQATHTHRTHADNTPQSHTHTRRTHTDNTPQSHTHTRRTHTDNTHQSHTHTHHR